MKQETRGDSDILRKKNKFLPLPGIRTLGQYSLQHSRYTDYAIPVRNSCITS